MPETWKFASIKLLLFCHLCLIWKFHHEVALKGLLYNNSHPRGDLVHRRIFMQVAPKTILSTLPKKELAIALSCLGKFPRQILAKINSIVKSKLSYCNFRFNFLVQSKCSMTLIMAMAKLNAIFKVRICEHLGIWHSVEKEFKVMTILPLKDIFCSAITRLILVISPI